MAVARSHAIIGNVTNALALINHAVKFSQGAASRLSNADAQASSVPLNVEVNSESVSFLNKLLSGELQRHRAIVHIDNIRKKSKEDGTDVTSAPLVERLNEYPAGGVDLDNIVEFPPKMALIPVKPIFLDVAWNYIDYPGAVQHAPEPAKAASQQQSQETQQTAKRGWFGFGRS